MNKGLKIFIFILIVIVLGLPGAIIKSYVSFPYYTLVGLIIIFVYRGMFKKKNTSEVDCIQSHKTPSRSVEINQNYRSPTTNEHSNLSTPTRLESPTLSISDGGNLESEIISELDLISQQKDALENLRGEDLFTDEEFNEKRRLLEQREVKIMEKRQELFIRKEAEPAIEKLTALLTAGVISKEEYDQKKEQLYSNKWEQYKDPQRRPSFTTIGSINYEQLERWNQQRVKEYLVKQKKGDQILYNSVTRNIYLLTKDEFDSLTWRKNYEHFLAIILPRNFKHH